MDDLSLWTLKEKIESLKARFCRKVCWKFLILGVIPNSLYSVQHSRIKDTNIQENINAWNTVASYVMNKNVTDDNDIQTNCQ